MSPDISKQFRGIEDLFESQSRLERINFIGTDISPVFQVDPPSLDIGIPVLEEGTVTGVATTVVMSTVPAGQYREILYATANHDDPAPIAGVEFSIVRAADGAFIIVRETFASLANPTTTTLFGQAHRFVPPGWFVEVEFPALAVGQIARIKTLHIDRTLGLQSMGP